MLNSLIAWRIHDELPEYSYDSKPWISLMNNPDTNTSIDVIAQILQDKSINDNDINIVLQTADELGIFLQVMDRIEEMLLIRVHFDSIKTSDDAIKVPTIISCLLNASRVYSILIKSAYIFTKLWNNPTTKNIILSNPSILNKALYFYPKSYEDDKVIRKISTLNMEGLNNLTGELSTIIPSDQDKLLSIFPMIDKSSGALEFFSQNKWVTLEPDTTFFIRCLSESTQFARAILLSSNFDLYFNYITSNKEILDHIIDIPSTMAGLMMNQRFFDFIINTYEDIEIIPDPPEEPGDPEEEPEEPLEPEYIRVYPYRDILFQNKDVMLKLVTNFEFFKSIIVDMALIPFSEFVKDRKYVNSMTENSDILTYVFNNANMMNILDASPLVIQFSVADRVTGIKINYENKSIITSLYSNNAAYRVTVQDGNIIFASPNAPTISTTTWEKTMLVTYTNAFHANAHTSTTYTRAIRYIPLIV